MPSTVHLSTRLRFPFPVFAEREFDSIIIGPIEPRGLIVRRAILRIEKVNP